MSLQMILGNSGSGKTRRLYETVIREARERPDEEFLVIVPEQFSLQTQKELVSLHPRHGILNIDVLSFRRLARRVFEEIGVNTGKVLEETGKNLLLRKIAQEREDSLRVLGGNMKKQGYITQVKSMISELTQYDISPEQLGELAKAQQGRPSLELKLEDVQILYEGFQERLHQGYVAAEELLELLAEHAGRSDILKGCTIALDGFTGFTPIQQKLLLELLKLARRVYVTVTIDIREELFRVGPMHELFYLSRKTICSLNELAGRAGCVIDEPILLGKREGDPQKKAALDFLEQHIYRSGPGGRAVYRAKTEEISVHAAANPLHEAEFAARTIWHLVREENWHYSEIAVIAGDLKTYANPIRRAFDRYQIPVFIDETRKVLLNPALEFVRAALQIAKQNYSRESVVRLLRTGLADVTLEETDLLENYLRAAGIRGKSRWEKPWERCTRTLGENETAQCEQLRSRIMEKLRPFTEQMKGKKTGKEFCIALYSLCVSCKIQEQLFVREQTFQAAGQTERAKEYSQIYRIIMELLDKMAELLGDESMTAEEFGQLLEAGFEEAKAGLVPMEPDRVTAGDLERTRLKNIRALFFVGLNDGLVPAESASGGFLTDQERLMLTQAGASLAPGLRENSYIQRFYLYQHLTKPSDRLYLSFSRSSGDGTPLRPSNVIARICRLFPAIEIEDEERWTDLTDRVTGPVSALPYLTESLPRLLRCEESEAEQELYRWYLRQEEYCDKITALVKASFQRRPKQGLGAKIAQALYGQNMENSVSRLERYAACAYAHFLMYGLELSEREEYEFLPADMGNVFHGVLELFAKKLTASDYTWFNVPEEVQRALVHESLLQTAEDYGGQILHSSARSEFAIRRMERILCRTVWAICEQVKRGGFIPESFELSFRTTELAAANFELQNGQTMRLRGRIDRIDVCAEDEEVFVKVVDYKSGNTAFDLTALYYGLQLQLIVYMNAALELEQRIYPDRKILPAGIFYYHIKDPMLDLTERTDEEELRKKLLLSLRPDGLVNGDPEVIRRMDRTIEKVSDVLPVSFNKDGSLSKSSKAAAKEEFDILSDYVTERLLVFGREILAGNADPNPYERKGRTPCEFCPYGQVCCFDKKIAGNTFRRLKEYSPEVLFERMQSAVRERKEGEKDGDGMDG